MEKIEAKLSCLSEFELLMNEKKGSLIDAISSYVVSTGFSEKMRELRHEFLARAEFKNAEVRMASAQDLQKQHKENQNMFNVQKAYINDLQETVMAQKQSILELKDQLQESVSKEMLEKVEE